MSNIPELTLNEIRTTIRHVKELVKDVSEGKSSSNELIQSAIGAVSIFDMVEVNSLIFDEEQGIAFATLFLFVSDCLTFLREADTESKDIIYLKAILIRMFHIIIKSNIIETLEKKIPDWYETNKDNLNWSLFDVDLDDIDPKKTTDNPVQKTPNLALTPQKKGIDALPEDTEEINQIKETLGEHTPVVKVGMYNPNINYWQELDSLIGLQRVKDELRNVVNYYKLQKKRMEMNPDLAKEGIVISFNSIFKGKPGTGKTTVARIVGGILRQEGLLSRGHLIETSDVNLCSMWVGLTPIQTKYQALLSRGGVLFIDEAYNLANHKGAKCDMGAEVIDTLTPMIENYRTSKAPITVILAGYENEMDEFLKNVNPGFASRFKNVIHFDDYNAEEMYTIFNKIMRKKGYNLSGNADILALKLFKSVEKQKDYIPTFANARSVRSLFETIEQHFSSRMMQIENPSFDEINTIIADDMKLSADEMKVALGIIS